MARSRNIKPSIMDNEELAALPALTRLLFIYMWMLADRDGRLEDRPARIKKQALGYDAGNADDMLNELVMAGFIERYEAKGAKVIQIMAFNKHQTPHIRESASELPSKDISTAWEAPSTTKAVPSTDQGGAEPSPRSPDTPFLIPDSLIPDPLTEAKASSSSAKPDALPPCPHAELIDLFGQHLPMLPQPKVEAWSGARAKALQTRWRWVLTAKKRDGTRYATNRNEALAWFSRYFNFVARSDFLSGRDGKWTGCDLGWLANETNFAKVIQGNYDNRELEAA